MTMTNIQDLKENFLLFDDWEERYGYLIDLGKNLPEMKADEKMQTNLIPGCVSKVWMIYDIEEEEGEQVLKFQADSDAHIVRGLIGLLMAVYQGQPIERIKDIDIEALFSEIGLDKHLSPNRRNGFFAMVQKIRSIA